MKNNFQEIAKSIRSNAKHVLESKKIESMIKEIGELFYTGSYALDLMTWNDIDMQVVVREGTDPKEAFCSLFDRIAKDPGFIEAQMIHFQGNYKPKMPRGLYLGIKMDCPDLGGIWKLDLWSLAKPDFEKNRTLIETLKGKLDPQVRDLILELKHEMMSGSERVPQMGSHFLYQAILLEGIRDKQALYQYFASQGVSIKK
ncbi:MAG: hypothetical protein JSR39_02440 [Verrucomicrobia bacterium]|nr:hypothetical protein [Verrucomicrobiota bacterium]